MKSNAEIDAEKRLVASVALRWVRPGMRLGLGSGSTSEWFARHLGEALRSGALTGIVAVPTSEKVAALAASLGIPLVPLEEGVTLDLTVDGADEIGPGLALIKGGGAALLREKVVAAASRRSVIMADSSKLVQRLGKFPLPLEVAPFAIPFVKDRVAALGGRARLRVHRDTGEAVGTDQGLHLLDCHFGSVEAPGIDDPWELERRLEHIPGVAAHGLFLDTTTAALVADAGAVRVHTRSGVFGLDEVNIEKL